MNRAKQAETTAHNRTAAPLSATDRPIDFRPLPVGHLRQRGGAMQTKHEADGRASHRFEAARAAVGTASPAPPCSARTRSHG